MKDQISMLGVLLLLSYFVSQVSADEFCPSRDLTLLEEGRNCRKPCKIDENCTAEKKGCFCDGYCGLSCFNKESTCGEPENITDGRVRRTHIKWGGTAYYTCNEEFVLIGIGSRVCHADKKWGGSPPTCERGCPRPDDVANSFPTNGGSGFLVGREHDFSCHSGFYMTGSSTRTCISLDEGWSDAEYSCAPQNCDDIPDVPNGYINKTIGNQFGSIATVLCHKGYQSSSSARSMKCFPGESDSAYGDWRGTLPSCSIKMCENPMPPDNGFIQHIEYIVPQYGTAIIYKCNSGYKINGPETGFCNEDREWGVRPTCIENADCDFNEFSSSTCGYSTDGWSRELATEHTDFNGYVARSTKYESRLTSVQLPAGWATHSICLKFYYKLPGGGPSSTGLLNVKGDDGNYWRCHKRETAEQWLNAAVTINAEDGARFTFYATKPSVYLDDIFASPEECIDHCNEDPCQHGGTCVNRISSYTCFCTIDFTGEHCEIDMKCDEAPENIPHGLRARVYHKKNFLIPGATVRYSCDQNYKFSNERVVINAKTITCVADGNIGRSRWNLDLHELSCEEITCSLPVAGQNQRLLNPQNKWSVGNIAHFRCHAGFESWNTNTMHQMATDLTCKNNGEWSGNPPTCVRPYCTYKQESPQVVYREDKYLVGSKIYFKCNLGYEIEGEPELTCSGMNRWNADLPTCQRVRCTLPNIENVHGVQSRMFYPGQSLNVRCASGYFVLGSRHLTCLYNKRWSPMPPICEEITSCSPTATKPSIPNGKIIRQNSGHIRYQCNDMYTMKGHPEIYCGKNNEWVGDLPVCEDEVPSGYASVDDIQYLAFLDETLKSNYTDAQKLCSAVGGNLAMIYSQTIREKVEQSLLNELGDYENLLIGLKKDPDNHNNFKWDTSSLNTNLPNDWERYNDRNWGYRRDRSKECVVINKSGWPPHKWRNVLCTERNSFLCQRNFLQCRPNPCQNGGICTTFDSGYNCRCSGFSGRHCQTKIQCHFTEFSAKGFVSEGKSVYSVGEEAPLICDVGYTKLRADSVALCQSDGKWSNANAFCQKISCGEPNPIPRPLRMDVGFNDYPMGIAILLICDTGFELMGNSILQCEKDGTWTEIIARCEEVFCENPHLPQHAYIEEPAPRYAVQTSINVECRDGYMHEGRRSLECQADKSWNPSESKIICSTEIDETTPKITTTLATSTTTVMSTTTISGGRPCGKPELPDSAYIKEEIDVFLSGSSITLSCLDNRSTSGDAVWRCEDGAWMTTDVSCVVQSCSVDGILLMAGIQVGDYTYDQLSGKEFAVGDQITLTCSGSGTPTHWEDPNTDPIIACQMGGRWSPYYGDFDCVE